MENIEYSIIPIIIVNKEKIIAINSIAKELFNNFEEYNYSLKSFVEKEFNKKVFVNIKKAIKENKEKEIININNNLFCLLEKYNNDNYYLKLYDISYLKLQEEINNLTTDIIIITRTNGEMIYGNKSYFLLLHANKERNNITNTFEVNIKKIIEDIEKNGITSINIKFDVNNITIYISFLIKKITIKDKEYLIFSGKNITELIEYQKVLSEYLKNQTIIMESFEILIKNKSIEKILEEIEKKIIKNMNIEGIEFIENGKSIYSSTKTKYYYDINFSPSLDPEKKIIFRIYLKDIKFLLQNLHIKESLIYIFTNIFNTYEKIIFINRLKEERDKALKADKLKSCFLSNLSHEIRTPLNGIIGFLQLIESDNVKPEMQEYINIIKESSERLIRNIENILYLSKIETGDVKVRKQNFVIDEVIDEVVKKYKKSVDEKKISLELILKNKNKKLNNDREKIKKIITEILDNSIKFTEKGKITLSLEDEDNIIRIIVKDTGIGIPKEDIKDSIFEKFFQSENIKSKKNYGLGIGLPIVKKLINMLHGKIKIESSENNTSITITIPREL
ncbi:MAG TPA: HAMP domain-containing sensor histidine kinase [Spirochaetota bacterium]|nr:HAMP domain-containing sensor histidine kinase [Spirochaetota bacterium]HOM39090.1 HAMP domain-containing sensor histidine kinase [Spirochaetota bacterium]HPQ49583.1 HAMP domain-containing sensor histidine kinase [Spirochaetota bacterium]